MLLMTNGNWLGLKTSRDGNPGTAALVAKGIRDSDPRVWRRGWELGGPVEGQGLGHPQPQSSCQEGPPSFSICFTVAVRAEFTVSTVLHVFPRQTRRAQRRIHIFPTSIHSHLRKEGEGDHGGRFLWCFSSTTGSAEALAKGWEAAQGLEEEEGSPGSSPGVPAELLVAKGRDGHCSHRRAPSTCTRCQQCSVKASGIDLQV